MHINIHYRSLVIFILFAWTQIASVHSQTNRDSLWSAWQNEALPDTHRLNALQRIAWPMLFVNLDSSRALFEQQLALARKSENDRWIGKALYNLATASYHKGDPKRAFELYEESLPYRIKGKDRKGEAAIYGNLGLILSDQGKYLQALDYLRQSLAINLSINDTLNTLSNYINFAIIYNTLEDSAMVFEYYDKCLRLAHPVRHKRDYGVVYNNIGMAYKAAGMYERSLGYLEKSLAIRVELKDRMGQAINQVNIGNVLNHMGRYADARKHVMESISLFEMLKDEGSLVHTYFVLGDIAYNEGKYRESIQWCAQSLEIVRASGNRPEEVGVCECLYRSHKALGNLAEALYYNEQVMALKDSLNENDVRLSLSKMELQNAKLADSLSRAEERSRLQLEYQQVLNVKRKQVNWALTAGIFILSLAILFLVRMLYFRRRSDALIHKTRELEKQQLISEVALLRSQVNPHFLFNSLSILSSLVRVDPDLSERFIDQLSKSYRYILEQKEQSLVTLRTELGFIESYAFLLGIRFEHKFKLMISIPEPYLDHFRIAPLTLQLLVENAVKHNRMSLIEPLVVHIGIHEPDTLIVQNHLQPRSTPSDSTGIGLQNIRNRYALLTDQPVVIEAVNDAFVVRIPLIREPAAETVNL